LGGDAVDRILIIDDEAAICSSLGFALEDRYRVRSELSARAGLRAAKYEGFDLVLLDLRIGEADGIATLSELCKLPDPPVVIMMSAYGTIESSVEAMRRGAFGYLQKPLRIDELVAQVEQALEYRRLDRRVEYMSHELEARYGYAGIVGKSAGMRRVFELVERLKDVDTTVVVRGESGTGKELIARALHYSGKRKAEPFVEINCGAIPEALLEGELFGYRRGAFTGAVDARQGKFAYAGEGTLLLDEIGDMPPPLQVKLLQVLQQKEVTPLGANSPEKVNARVVAATNADLAALVEAGANVAITYVDDRAKKNAEQLASTVEGMKKIVLKVADEKELRRFLQLAKDSGLVTALIADAGHTVVEPGTVTCLGIGPDDEARIDPITGKLKML